MIPASLLKAMGELDKAAFDHGRAAGRLDAILDALYPPAEPEPKPPEEPAPESP